MTIGRPRAEFDRHKDLIIKLYHDRTPWSKIEEILLNEHGCKAKARTIMRRFKDWDLEFHRVVTKHSDNLKDQIRSHWEDRSSRPRNDEEMVQRLRADGISASLTAVKHIRKDLKLYRRWDEKLGRVRPDSELGKRKRRKQKHSAFTDARLAPPPGIADPEDDQHHSRSAQSDVPQQPWSPEAQGRRGSSNDPAAQHLPRLRLRSSPETAQHPGQACHRSMDADIASRDAHIKLLLDQVSRLEQHCLAHRIGLPYKSTASDVPGPARSTAADKGHWEDNSGLYSL